MKQVDFIIIGQGLAGSLLAYRLIKLGRSVMVLDNAHQGSSSKVAAGLINPITGHRLNITDGFFSHFELVKKRYWQLERDLGCSVFREIKQTRLIKNAGQSEYLAKRLREPAYDTLLKPTDDAGDWFADKLRFPYGRISVGNTAAVDTKVLLHRMREWLEERESYQQHLLDYRALRTDDERFQVSTGATQVVAKKIIFCEGYQAHQNPWLSELPFKFAKGEILTVQTERPVDRMLSWGMWLVPSSTGPAKLGSNFIWNDVTLNANESTQSKFISTMKTMTDLAGECLNHEVGIRPSTVQRKPFVGPLTNLPNAYCLNGLGSKGCLIAPHYVDELCNHMIHKSPLAPEITQWL